MKKIGNIKLNRLNEKELEKRELNLLKGGGDGSYCACACAGPSSTSANDSANDTYGYGGSGYGGTCSCGCSVTSHGEDFLTNKNLGIA